MRWSSAVLDTYVAPELSKVTACSAPELAECPNYWGSFVLNSIFIIKLQDHVTVMMLNFLKRLMHAHREYRHGKEQLQAYVATLPETDQINLYGKALFHFENCLTQTYLAVLCIEALSKMLKVPHLFVRKDGSDYDRMLKLYNRMKHYDEDVADAFAKQQPISRVLPIWLTNDGMEGADGTRLSFADLVAILDAARIDAEKFSDKLPEEMAVRRAAGSGQPAGGAVTQEREGPGALSDAPGP